MSRKGFTLIELLAVIVILGIILAIAIPGIAGIINSATKSSFQSDAKMVLKAIDYKFLENDTFDPTTVDASNIVSKLNIPNDNYSTLVVTMVNNKPYVTIVGKNKWANLTAYGKIDDMKVVNTNDYDITPPVITLVGTNPLTIEAGSTYTDAGTTATDNHDGNITSKIVVVNHVNASVAGTYTVTYNVSDASGNAATQVTRTVTVVDAAKPVITLNGSSTVAIAQGSTYADAGATATDNVDGNITSRIVTTGTVNINTIGTYTITYNVSDSAGNAATTATRTVQVINPITNFAYTGASQTFTVPVTGTYKLEVWGAQGGNSTTGNTWGSSTTLTATGGKGGYAKGEITLNAGQTITIYVGGQGGTISSIFNYPSVSFTGSVAGGWNGGGSGAQSGFSGGGGGGGATDIRSGGTTLSNRIIVAGAGGGAGGGGSTNPDYGGNGGDSGLNGSIGYANASYGTAGTPGTASALASSIGGDAVAVSSSSGAGAGGGGGGGYYAGTGSAASTGYSPVSSCNGSCSGGGSGGGGGSSYTGTLTSSQTIAGNASMPAPSGGTETGHSGNGYARVTYIIP